MVNPATARDMARALNNYAMRAELGHDADYEALQVCKAAFQVCDDGDFYRLMEDICSDRGWDEDGYPVDAEPCEPDKYWRESIYAERRGRSDFPTASESTIPAIGGR